MPALGKLRLISAPLASPNTSSPLVSHVTLVGAPALRAAPRVNSWPLIGAAGDVLRPSVGTQLLIQALITGSASLA